MYHCITTASAIYFLYAPNRNAFCAPPIKVKAGFRRRQTEHLPRNFDWEAPNYQIICAYINSFSSLYDEYYLNFKNLKNLNFS